ncbi:alpha-L-rhamnosidase [Oceanispirochaeta sp.]|jgi:alpha-L-rhamnosidase|uniref:alpha-L-rhamnosidase n=1 Tax=Oceanispirochaeta sp. TaxID=2035350 RepID=UPI0026208EF0|nr:alpha-L-rhamnosidase [Oceanispirochaeta sp.]MDA3957808.1 family 78 glycoside hydrolase catalytic domain [Oceanispirochaeta sp.]
MLNINNVKCENLTNPIGIDSGTPRISWISESLEKEISQKSYEIEVSTDKEFTQFVWQSGPVTSSRSHSIKYQGSKLLPVTRYWFRIRITDNFKNSSEWSRAAYFETSLLSHGKWRAPFISSPEDTDEKLSKGWIFQKEINIRKGLESARLYATALGVYEAFVQGERIGNQQMTPGWTNYSKRLLYQCYDITKNLREGENILAGHIGAGWYKGDLAGWVGKRCVYGKRNALSMQILLRFEDGSQEWIKTDKTWKAGTTGVISSEIYHGEEYDARRENPRSWTEVEILPAPESVQITAQDGPLTLPQETLKPREIILDSQGRSIIDFGQNMTGFVRFKVKGKAGDRVKLKHAEILSPPGEFYTENLRSARQEILYTLKGEGTEVYQPRFTFQGFRYVLVEEYPGKVKADDFEAIVLHSDMEKSGDFDCSHPLLNQLHHNILWGMKGNFLDIPTDCPQRDERLGWTGDAQVFISTACNLMDASGFFTKWLRDMRSEQNEKGGIPHVIPDVLQDVASQDDILKGAHSATGWADAMTICPWEIYVQYGDPQILEENYDAMKGWISYMRGEARDEVLWDTGFHFGDWVALDAKEGSYFGATPNDFTATVFYANSVQIMIKTAKVLGFQKDLKEFTNLYERIVKAFQNEFFTPTGRLAVNTQTAHVLALYFNLTPEPYIKRTVDTLVRLLENEEDHLLTGFLGTPYLCAALSRNGRLDKAYKLLLQEDYPSWLYQVKQGATTIWEHWDGLKPDGSLWSPDMNSFNHYAYGSVGYWMYTVVAGLSLDENDPGYKTILFQPQPGGGLTHARASQMTPFGKASISWKIQDREFSCTLQIPVNARGRMKLPGQEKYSELGSGEYSFQVDLP